MDIMLLSFLWLSTVAHRTQKSLIFACTVSRSLPVKVSCLSSTVFGRDYFLLLGFPWGYCPFGFCPVKNFIGIFCYVTWYVILKFLSLSYDLESSTRWIISWNRGSRSAWRKRTWRTRRSMVPSLFLALVIFKF